MLRGLIGFFTAILFSFSLFISDAGTSEDSVSLQFIQPAGISPKIFTEGWVFGADFITPALVSGKDNSEDIDNVQVHWSGTGKFFPEYGPITHPIFDNEGENTITASINLNGKTYSKTLTVNAVLPDLYAAEGDYVFCGNDSHGCNGCPHPVTGLIISGSSTVKVRGKNAARVGDGGMHLAQFQCCGENRFTISEGDESVMIDGRPAAKIGSATKHCGGIGIITGENVSYDEFLKEEKNIYNSTHDDKVLDMNNVFFPAELVPKSYVKRFVELKQNASADRYVKLEGPDYTIAKTDMLDKVSEIFGMEAASLAFIQETGNIECFENINKYCGRIGFGFSVMEIVNNVYEGKKTDAFYNTLKSMAYMSLDYGWSSLKIASFGVVLVEYTLKKFIKEMIDSRFESYKNGYYKYYNDDSHVKRDIKAWRRIIGDIYDKAKSSNSDFQTMFESEINDYLTKFWNPEVYGFYIPPTGLVGEVGSEDKIQIQDAYRKEILNPIFNAVFVSIFRKEQMKVEKGIKEDIQKLADGFNSKIHFIVRVKGPKEKINKFLVKIGEWSGLTNDKGIWDFNATVYAYAKNLNKYGKPLNAIFVVGEKDEREVDFQLKNTVEIEFTIPKPVSLSLDLALSKDTEGSGYSAMATASNFDKFTIPGSESGVKVEWVWKINGTLVNSFEGGLELTSSNISGTFDEPGDYVVEASLINMTENTTNFSKPLAVATKKVTVKKDRTKEKEIEITKKDEEPKKQEEKKKEEKKEVEPYYEHSIPMNGGYANYNYKKDYTILVFVPVGDRAKFSDGVYKWKIKEGWEKVVSEFSGQASFIFPYHSGSFYVIECSNSSGTVTFSKPLRLE